MVIITGLFCKLPILMSFAVATNLTCRWLPQKSSTNVKVDVYIRKHLLENIYWKATIGKHLLESNYWKTTIGKQPVGKTR
ncbi:MAG: hypothetical protein CSB48_00430 [Proteobacteria bacterium]|nr:MAG: hypothetical protein CSB48_00430 [Pseudomonadota bacterium]